MDRFEELKLKYQSVLRLMEQKSLRMHNLHVQDNKLFIKASADKLDVAGITHALPENPPEGIAD